MRARLASLALLLAAACGGGGAASKPAVTLAFTVQPADGTAVSPLAPAVKVEVRDADGLLVAGAVNQVTLALADPSGGATLGGVVTRAAVGGVATFSELAVSLPGAGYRLSASAAGLTGATSAAFDVSAGPAASLLVTGQPADGRTATPLTPAFEVRVEDAVGNAVDAEVTVRLVSGPAGATLGGSTTATASGGVATFPDLSAAVAGGYVLEAAVAGVPPVVTQPFTLTDAWRTLPLEGGPVAVAMDPAEPTTALAGGPDHVGLWRTRDGGATWAAIPALRDRALRPVFERPGVAWAVGDSVWRSGDGGLTWVESPGLVRMPGGAAMGPAFGEGGAIYLVVSDYEQRLLVSHDGGASWAPVSPAPAGSGAIISVAAGAAGVAVLTHQGFELLAPGALAWTAPVAVDFNPTRVLLHPTDARVALVAGFTGIQRSEDGGATWTQSIGYLWRDLAFDPASPDTVVAAAISIGAYRSTDGGRTFESLGTPAAIEPQSIAVAAGRLWYGADTGPYTSADGGASWTKAAGGLTVARVSAVAVSPGDSSVILAGTGPGELWRSADGGASWTRVAFALGQAPQVILFDPAAPERVYFADGGYLMRSTDAGATWAITPGAQPGAHGLAMCRQQPATLWTHDQSGTGVWRSTDRGGTWTKVYTGIVGELIVVALAADDADPLLASIKVYDGAPPYSRGGQYRTADGGATWTKVSQAATGRLVAGLPGELWSVGFSVDRSTDGGLTFAPASGPWAIYPNAVAADPRGPGRLLLGGNGSYAYQPGDGVWSTTDGGATWRQSKSGHERFATGALAVDPGQPEVFYAGTLGGGLLVTTTGGR